MTFPIAQDKAHRILAQVRAVPSGQVRGYGQIARLAGLPGAARLVARVLSRGGADVPWHRVVRADGRIAFAPGTREFDEQCARLRAEGVPVVSGRVRAQTDASLAGRWLDEVLARDLARRPDEAC